ncbi:hypothetical protein LguiA_027243 [Lonicera macranthoides]
MDGHLSFASRFSKTSSTHGLVTLFLARDREDMKAELVEESARLIKQAQAVKNISESQTSVVEKGNSLESINYCGTSADPPPDDPIFDTSLKLGF